MAFDHARNFQKFIDTNDTKVEVAAGKNAADAALTARGQDAALTRQGMQNDSAMEIAKLGQPKEQAQPGKEPGAMGKGFSTEPKEGAAWAFDKTSGQYGYKDTGFNAAKSDAAMYAKGISSGGEASVSSAASEEDPLEFADGGPVPDVDEGYTLPPAAVEILGREFLDWVVQMSEGEEEQAPPMGGPPPEPSAMGAFQPR